MENQEIDNRLKNIETMLLGQKRVLSFSEGCRFIGMSESYAYKLTSARLIPHSKPDGKKIFFDREELEAWLLRNPVKTKNQLLDDIKAVGKKA
jgi:excisionase family DNA binding protein